MSSLRLTHWAPLVCVAVLAGATGCEREEPAQYPQQQYPQQQYPQQQYPQQQYPQQQYPQQQYPQQQYPQQPAQPAPTPQPTTPATGGQPTAIPGLEKMPDGTCRFTPPALTPDQAAQPMTVPCPPGI